MDEKNEHDFLGELLPEEREIMSQKQEKLRELEEKLMESVGEKHFFTLKQLNDAFDKAENITAAHFNSQACSMLSVDGKHECPICYFRIQVKDLLGVV